MIPTTSSLLLDTDRIYYLGQCSDLLASMSEVDSSLATHRMEGWLRNLALDHPAPTPATRVQRRTARFKSRAQNLAFLFTPHRVTKRNARTDDPRLALFPLFGFSYID